jgi:hypothetical protein
MRANRQQSSTVSRPFQWLAAALSLLVLALGPLAVRPDWHVAVHVHAGDTAHGDHDHSHEAPPDERGCAIELFAAGHVDVVAFASPAINALDFVAFELTIPAGRPTPALLHLEPPGRAPPFSA